MSVKIIILTKMIDFLQPLTLSEQMRQELVDSLPLY